MLLAEIPAEEDPLPADAVNAPLPFIVSFPMHWTAAVLFTCLSSLVLLIAVSYTHLTLPTIA